MSNKTREALELCIDVIERLSYRWTGAGTPPSSAVDAARTALAQLTTEQRAAGHELFAELYQILGELGAGEAVLDQVLAASQGEPLPHGSLLPYAAEQPDTVAVPRELLAEAESIIDSYAESLKAGCAPGGDWDGEDAAQDDYEREAGVAAKLRRLLAGGDKA